MTRPEDARAARLLQRAERDPEFDAELRAAYSGRHDVLDALWWAAHPHTDSPRGIPDPAISLIDLQHAVFSRAAADSPLTEVLDPETGTTLRLRESELRLREAQRGLADDARQLGMAMDAVDPPRRPPAEERPAPEPAAGAAREVADARSQEGSADDPHPAAPDPETGSSPAAPPPRRKILLPALAGMGILSAVLLLPTLSELDADADDERLAAPTTAPRITTEIVTLSTDGAVSDPYTILKRQQSESDHPPIGFPDNHAPGSFRALPGMVAHAQLYLARGGQPDTICLAVVLRDLTGMSSCVPDSVFAQNGIYLSGGRYGIDADTTILTESYSLLPSGDFHYEATARVRESPGQLLGERIQPSESGVEGG